MCKEINKKYLRNAEINEKYMYLCVRSLSLYLPLFLSLFKQNAKCHNVSFVASDTRSSFNYLLIYYTG